MNNPTVCAILLTRDRPEFAAKAVECFRRQTYPNLCLFVLDTGEKCAPDTPYGENRATTVWMPEQCGKRTIGELRNGAIKAALGYMQFDIVAHLDDDDWSHPNRIAEQVALLQASGADVVGYNELLFWRYPARCDVIETTQPGDEWASFKPGEIRGEAWLFQCAKNLTPALGSSLCYWRKTWERTKFADLPKAPGGMSEYRDFLRMNKVEAVSSLFSPGQIGPSMIARIHGGNFMPYNIEEQIERGSNALPNEGWHRVPEWDARVREILK